MFCHSTNFIVPNLTQDQIYHTHTHLHIWRISSSNLIKAVLWPFQLMSNAINLRTDFLFTFTTEQLLQPVFVFCPSFPHFPISPFPCSHVHHSYHMKKDYPNYNTFRRINNYCHYCRNNSTKYSF